MFFLGIASDIRMFRDPHARPFISTSARSRWLSSAKRTKPNPFERPVAGSVTTLAFRTLAYLDENTSWSMKSFTSGGRSPTKMEWSLELVAPPSPPPAKRAPTPKDAQLRR
eukprot:31225-Pelagococcus_subviridis.AAC.14